MSRRQQASARGLRYFAGRADGLRMSTGEDLLVATTRSGDQGPCTPRESRPYEDDSGNTKGRQGGVMGDETASVPQDMVLARPARAASAAPDRGRALGPGDLRLLPVQECRVRRRILLRAWP